MEVHASLNDSVIAIERCIDVAAPWFFQRQVRHLAMLKGFAKRILPSRLVEKARTLLDPVRRGSAFFSPYIIKKDMEGETFDFLIGDREGRAWYDYECINNPRWLEMRFIKERIIEKGDVVLECGSHHGCSTILLSRWVGEHGKVIAFEPFPSNFNILKSNVELNRLTNVESHQKAIGSAAGSIAIDQAKSAVSSTGAGRAVEVTNLDAYEYLHPTLLKIDVEGFEAAILRGARHILDTRPKLALEIHADLLAQYGASVDDVLDLIDMSRYRTWIQVRDDQWPEEYVPGRVITTRAHLFCLPR